MLMAGSSIRLPKSEIFPPPRSPFPLSSHSPTTIIYSFEPSIPYAPNYQSKVGQISKDFYSRIEVPRGHTDGEMTFPWGLTVTVQSVGTLKHTWSYKVMADAISSYVRGSTFLPNILPVPIATMNWYQAWDPSGKGTLVFSPPLTRIY